MRAFVTIEIEIHDEDKVMAAARRETGEEPVGLPEALATMFGPWRPERIREEFGYEVVKVSADA